MNLSQLIFAVALTWCTVVQATTAPYPARPVRLVNPFTPGGSVDFVCRAVAQRMTEAWGQVFIVDNRPGAGTNIGTEIVARAQADGHTLLCNTGTIATNPSFYPNMTFSPIKALSAVILISQVPNLLAVNSSVAARSVRELIDMARAKPGGLTFASAGTGSSTHLSMELFKSLTKVDLTHIPYKGGGPVITDLVAGQVNGTFNPLGSLLPHVKSGRLRGLGITSTTRSEFAPDIPTIAEAGVPTYEAIVWYALFAPRKMSATIAQKWNAEINLQLKGAPLKERLASNGMSPMGGTTHEADAYFAHETTRWSQLIRNAKISIQQ